MSLNHITVMGRLTKNPELRYTQSQTPVASFTVAVDRDFSGKDGGEKQTDFIDCVAWRQTAEFVNKYFQKGSMAVVSGRLQSRKWQDKDGNNRISWEINVDNVYFGSSKSDGQSSNGSSYGGGHAQPQGQSCSPPGSYQQSPQTAPQYQQTSFQEIGDEDGDLPF